MADARLTISIQDDTRAGAGPAGRTSPPSPYTPTNPYSSGGAAGTPPPPAGSYTSGARSYGNPGDDISDRWRKMLDRMERATAAFADRLGKHTGTGGGGGGTTGGKGGAPNLSDRAALEEAILRAPGVKSFGLTRQNLAGMAEQAVRELASKLGLHPGNRGSAGRAKFMGLNWSQLSHREQQKIAMEFGGQPPGVTDKEWATFGRASVRAGRPQARAAGQRTRELLTERRRKEAEEDAERNRPIEEARRRSAMRTARGKAWRKVKTRQRRVARIARGKAMQMGLKGAAAATIATAVHNGGAVGEVALGGLGAVAGGALGGPMGAAIGGAIGAKVGQVVDDPFAAPKSFAQKTARGDTMGMVDTAGGAALAASMLLSSNPVTLPLGMLAGAAALAAKGLTAVKDTADAFAARGRELAGYSGSIAGAAAMQDVTRTLTDIREAQRLGDKYAQVIDAQTRFEETLKAGLMPLKEWIMEHLPKWLDWILNALIKVGEILAKITPGDMVDKIVNEMKAMKDALTGGALPGSGADLAKSWLLAPISGTGLSFPMPAAPPAPGGLGIPIIPTP